MRTTTALTTGQATADAWAALRSAGIEPQRVQSIWMGYQPFLGGIVIETEARVTADDWPGRQGTGVPARR